MYVRSIGRCTVGTVCKGAYPSLLANAQVLATPHRMGVLSTK
jgi:hypothetical protein